MRSIDHDTFRRRSVAASLVLGPAALVVASTAKVVNSPEAREMLASVAAHPTREVVSDAAQLVACVLLVPATVGVLRFFRDRGSRLGYAAVALMVLNLLGNAADVVHGAVLTTLARDGVTDADVAALKAIDSTGVTTAVEAMVAIGILGFPLLALALWRAGTVARWVPAALVAGIVCFFFPISEGVGAAVMWVAFAGMGATLLRGDDEAAPAAVAVAVHA